MFFIFWGEYYNKKFGNKFFESDELYIGGAVIFLLGNPSWMYLWIFYLMGVFVGGIIGTFYINKICKKTDGRFSLYYLWLPLAIIGIIIMQFLI
jgi:hypothetical protein